MADKILATFRLAPDTWQAFQALAKTRSTNASRLLTEFVESYLTSPPPSWRTPAELELRLAHLEDQLAELLDNLDARIDRAIKRQVRESPQPEPGAIASLESQLAFLREQLAATEAELDEARQQAQQSESASPPALNYEAVARKVLDNLKEGTQSAGYKTAVKVLTQFIAEVKGASSPRTARGETASKLVSDAVVAHGVRFDVLKDVALHLGYELHKRAKGTYYIQRGQTILTEAKELTAIAAWLRTQPLPTRDK